MKLTNEEIKNAFRDAMDRELAEIEDGEEAPHIFSAAFCRRMDALVAEERGKPRLLSRRFRRTLVVAAVMLAVVVLVVCAVPRDSLSIVWGEGYVDYHLNAKLRDTLNTVYLPELVPEGFVLVEQTRGNSYHMNTCYEDDAENSICLSQQTPQIMTGAISRDTEVYMAEVGGSDVIFSTAEGFWGAVWIHDGYLFHMSCHGDFARDEVEALIRSLAPAGPPPEYTA